MQFIAKHVLKCNAIIFIHFRFKSFKNIILHSCKRIKWAVGRQQMVNFMGYWCIRYTIERTMLIRQRHTSC